MLCSCISFRIGTERFFQQGKQSFTPVLQAPSALSSQLHMCTLALQMGIDFIAEELPLLPVLPEAERCLLSQEQEAIMLKTPSVFSRFFVCLSLLPKSRKKLSILLWINFTGHRSAKYNQLTLMHPLILLLVQNEEPVFSRDGRKFFFVRAIPQGGRGHFYHIAMSSSQVTHCCSFGSHLRQTAIKSAGCACSSEMGRCRCKKKSCG